MKASKTITIEKAEIALLENGIVENRIKAMANLDHNDIAEIKSMNMAISGGKNYVLLISAGHLATISKEARELSACKEFAQKTIAKAILIDSLGQKLVSNLYLSVNKPHIETRLFTERDKAIAWLKERLNDFEKAKQVRD